MVSEGWQMGVYNGYYNKLQSDEECMVTSSAPRVIGSEVKSVL